MSQAALVHPIPFPTQEAIDKRATARHVCSLGAVSRPLESTNTLCWGAQVRNISAGGLGLSVCYPFKPGTYLAVDLQEAAGATRTQLVRVVHVEDQCDGNWLVGCEFAKPLSDSDVEVVV